MGIKGIALYSFFSIIFLITFIFLVSITYIMLVILKALYSFFTIIFLVSKFTYIICKIVGFVKRFNTTLRVMAIRFPYK